MSPSMGLVIESVVSPEPSYSTGSGMGSGVGEGSLVGVGSGVLVGGSVALGLGIGVVVGTSVSGTDCEQAVNSIRVSSITITFRIICSSIFC